MIEGLAPPGPIGPMERLPLARLGRPRYSEQLPAPGKKGGGISRAMANCANKITYALVRDQSGYYPAT